ncbi:MAG: hypothetical protein HY658_01510 [Actinobacteria bacterium]|nr:hypothetical protein [Actinomycetota bacterium]
MEMDRALLDQALRTLGETLEARGMAFELVVIGGSSLMLLGFITRPTKDLDAVALVEDEKLVPAEPLPPPLAEAIADVGRTFGLDERWLNAGPTDLLRFGLPEGFQGRVETRRYDALTLRIAGRFDQICFKLYATADQGMRSKHAADLRALQPAREELLAASRWSRTHDPSEGYRQELVGVLTALGMEDADGQV